MDKKSLIKMFGSEWEALKRNSDTIYIICPDVKCDGFIKDHMQCETKYYDDPCPKKDIAYKILHCRDGHPTNLEIDYGSWHRVDCPVKGCYASSFNLMSEKYVRIPLELVDDFLDKEFIKK